MKNAKDKRIAGCVSQKKRRKLTNVREKGETKELLCKPV